MIPESENISVEFKSAQVRPESVAREMVAFLKSLPQQELSRDNMNYIDGLGRGIPLIVRRMGKRAAFSEQGEMFCVRLDF